MKKILLSSLALLSLQIVTAQTLTEANHAPSAWDGAYSTKQCDSLSITPGVSGVGAVWSYTPTGYSLVSLVTSSHSTNTAYPMAYAAVKSGTVSESYYSSTPTTLNYYGGIMALNGQVITLNYSTPLKAMSYPFTAAASIITSSPIGTLSANGGAITGSFTGSAVVTAEASGTLNLPGRAFNDIIRIVTTQTLNATTGFGPVTLTQKNYDYYSVSASKAPIISINSFSVVSMLGPQMQTVTTVLNNYMSVGVNENTSEAIDLSVFPNPASSFISFNTSSLDASKVTVYDVTGRVVATDNFEIGKCKLDVSSLNGGVYIYSVLSKNNQTLKTGKFSVTK